MKKSTTKNINVRLDSNEYKLLQVIAEKEERSLANLVRVLIKRHIAHSHASSEEQLTSSSQK